MKKKTMALVLCVCFLALAACAKKDNTPWQKETIGQVSFEVNPEWNKKENKVNGFYYYPESGLIMSSRTTLDSAIEDVYVGYDQHLEGVESSSENFKLIAKEKKEIQGKKALWYEYTSKVNDIEMHFQTILVIVGENLYSNSCWYTS